MISPLLLFNKHQLKLEQIDQKTYIECYKESIRMIKEAAKCRQFEPENSRNFLAWCIKDVNDAVAE